MKIKPFYFIIINVLLLPMAWAAPGVHDLGAFKSIPVMDNGRLKPLDTFARSLLTQLSGKDHYEKQEAAAWLAALFFNPDSTLHDKIFLINNPEIPQALGIVPSADRRYTPTQLGASLNQLIRLDQAAEKIPEKERSLAENEIIRVYDNINLYGDLAGSFLFAVPQSDFSISSSATKVRLGLAVDQQNFSFLDIALKARALNMKDPEEARCAANLFRWSQEYKEMPLTVIFSSQQEYLSPWDAISKDFGDAGTRQLILFWNNMTTDYLQGKAQDFDRTVRMYINEDRHILPKDELKRMERFPLELFYQQSSLFTWSIMLYILAFMFFIISFTSEKAVWYNLGLCSVLAGFIPHLFGLILRIIIMARPPVSSLYETFIFVGCIAVFLGLLIEYYNRQWLGIVTAAISGTALLFIANKYSAEGDTLKVLVAVLNSNFWLATHVTTITMGYAATCVGGLLGHIWLVQSATGQGRQVLDKTYKTTMGILGVALTLTFLGTNLGGIWADQSWGRFWGWDPKENGALMIVLWTALLFHAKAGGMIASRGVAVGAVIGMMVVMWAWFGVNLLSVGLHSYGFTSGIANTLIVYAVLEVLFLLVTGIISFKKQSS